MAKRLAVIAIMAAMLFIPVLVKADGVTTYTYGALRQRTCRGPSQLRHRW